MTSDLEQKILKDLSNGTAWLVVLATVAGNGEPIHGYEIGRRLAEEAPDGLSFKQGTLYPMLRTMEAEGLVRSALVPSTEGPARKCFVITAEGRRVLATWVEAWKRTGRWMNRVIGGIDGNR
jgi:PadR family transcriptional regulator PadR